MTMHDGTTALSPAKRGELRDDLGPHGLLKESVAFDPEVLGPAVSASLAESRSGGRLAYQVCLPEAMWHCEDARVAVILPDWDVRRGRMHVDYSREDTFLELFGGRSRVLSGPWQVTMRRRTAKRTNSGPQSYRRSRMGRPTRWSWRASR